MIESNVTATVLPQICKKKNEGFVYLFLKTLIIILSCYLKLNGKQCGCRGHFVLINKFPSKKIKKLRTAFMVTLNSVTQFSHQSWSLEYTLRVCSKLYIGSRVCFHISTRILTIFCAINRRIRFWRKPENIQAISIGMFYSLNVGLPLCFSPLQFTFLLKSGGQ